MEMVRKAQAASVSSAILAIMPVGGAGWAAPAQFVQGNFPYLLSDPGERRSGAGAEKVIGNMGARRLKVYKCTEGEEGINVYEIVYGHRCSFMIRGTHISPWPLENLIMPLDPSGGYHPAVVAAVVEQLSVEGLEKRGVGENSSPKTPEEIKRRYHKVTCLKELVEERTHASTILSVEYRKANIRHVAQIVVHEGVMLGCGTVRYLPPRAATLKSIDFGVQR